MRGMFAADNRIELVDKVICDVCQFVLFITKCTPDGISYSAVAGIVTTRNITAISSLSPRGMGRD